MCSCDLNLDRRQPIIILIAIIVPGISAHEFVFQLDIGYPVLVDQRYGEPLAFLPQKFKVLDQHQEGEENHGLLSQGLGLTTELDTLLFLKRDPEGHLSVALCFASERGLVDAAPALKSMGFPQLSSNLRNCMETVVAILNMP